MSLTVRAALVAVGLLALTACSSSGDAPAPTATAMIDATTMRGALLQANEIGPTWAESPDSDPDQLVGICAGTATPPPVPPGGAVVATALVDEGRNGAQSLDQTALVFPDPSAAAAAQTALRAVADTCPLSVSVPATVNDNKAEPAYTESTQIQPLRQDAWTGFVVLRHKQYEPKHPGTADTAVVILTDRNVVLVDAYAVYRLNNSSTGPEFTADWQKLLASVLQRVR